MKVLLGVVFLAQLGRAQSEPSVADMAEKMLRQVIDLDPAEANSVVIDSTFQVTCATAAGTAFVLAREDMLAKPEYTLVTADHVFAACVDGGDESIVVRFRFRGSDPRVWQVKEHTFRIAVKRRRLWVKHPTADVAVLPIQVPDGVIKTPLFVGALADTRTLRNQLYLGRDVFALGYPFGESPQLMSGFPVLRVGQIASRIIDEKSVIALSFNVHPGDSGGPVYLVTRGTEGVHFTVVGLMIQTVVKPANTVKDDGKGRVVLVMVGVGYVATATEIAEALAQLHARSHGSPGKKKRQPGESGSK